MLLPGDKVSTEEVERIEEMGSVERDLEIEAIITQADPETDLIEGFRHALQEYYKNPDRYLHVPSPIRWDDKPLPYEGW